MELYISNAGQEPIYAQITRQIKDKIQAEVKYPGTVKVSVIREYRAVETAK